MKHTIFSIFIALLCIVPFTGCNKKDAGLGTMTAKINSDEFAAAYCTIANTGGWYSIKGHTGGSKQRIYIFLKGDKLTPATYTLADTITDHHASYDDATETHHASNGSVTITSVSNSKVSGTFTFRSIPQGIIVTDGAFTAMF